MKDWKSEFDFHTRQGVNIAYEAQPKGTAGSVHQVKSPEVQVTALLHHTAQISEEVTSAVSFVPSSLGAAVNLFTSTMNEGTLTS
jgi:hypothetical protein